MAWVQSATLSMNEENMKKLSDTTTKMISSFSALSQNDDNSDDDTNGVPSDALVYSNDISRDLAYANDYLFPLLPKSGKVFSSTYTCTFRNHVTNRDYQKDGH
ncbi:hypothetical protein ACLUXR_00500 [Limosilactobacillus reuteri subsp. suis]|uniref:hypothetical protein n=1 Tax=Limosilactobacillus reuteri TaxID=1598 RepID=UPI0039936441